MDQVDGVASSAGITFSELWNEFPWRYAIRSALEVARRQYHIEAALDWLAYLGVAGEFEEELQILGLDPRNIVLPRPRLEDYER